MKSLKTQCFGKNAFILNIAHAQNLIRTIFKLVNNDMN